MPQMQVGGNAQGGACVCGPARQTVCAAGGRSGWAWWVNHLGRRRSPCEGSRTRPRAGARAPGRELIGGARAPRPLAACARAGAPACGPARGAWGGGAGTPHHPSANPAASPRWDGGMLGSAAAAGWVWAGYVGGWWWWWAGRGRCKHAAAVGGRKAAAAAAMVVVVRGGGACRPGSVVARRARARGAAAARGTEAACAAARR